MRAILDSSDRAEVSQVGVGSVQKLESLMASGVQTLKTSDRIVLTCRFDQTAPAGPFPKAPYAMDNELIREESN